MEITLYGAQNISDGDYAACLYWVGHHSVSSFRSCRSQVDHPLIAHLPMIKFALHPQKQLVERRQFRSRRFIACAQDCRIHVACKLYNEKVKCFFTCHLPSVPRPTQPPTLSGSGNEYQPKCGDALWLGSKGRYGSFHLWINVWVAGKTV